MLGPMSAFVHLIALMTLYLSVAQTVRATSTNAQ